MDKIGICPLPHFKAILFRKIITIKRSGISLLLSSLGTLAFCSLGIISFHLMRSLLKQKVKTITFGSYGESIDHIFITKDTENANDYSSLLKQMYQQDTGRDLFVNMDFDDGESAQNQMYELGKDMKNTDSYGFGLTSNPLEIDIETETLKYSINTYDLLIYHNATSDFFGSSVSTLTQTVTLSRLFWKYLIGSKYNEADILYSRTQLLQKFADNLFSMIGPMSIAEGLLATIPLLITPIIEDVRGETRSYMVSCTLRILPYWLAVFVVDYIYWLVVITVVWLLFLICQIQAFLDNPFETWFVLAVGGISYLLFVYCFSFLFQNPDSAARQSFLSLIIILLVPSIVQTIINDTNPLALDYIYALFPHICMCQANTYVTTYIGDMKQNLSYFFKTDHPQAYFVMLFIDIPLYAIILIIIEVSRLSLQRKAAKMNFGNYMKFFEEQKGRHPVTEEAQQMADLIHSDSDEDWAVKIIDVSRLFMNTAGKPIPAVNNVSLGVKKGSLFGFLGANGAGKTTLIRMITSLLPPSAGRIEIEGTDITQIKDPTILSICPQFNSHLMDALTPAEHFTLFSLLFMLNEEEAKSKTNHLLDCLGLQELKDKPIRELSGGDVRKLAIAICFLGPAKIILLDEPTASLDPVVRHHVHEMLIENKGEKTFMLCTHLLSEAETLCDTVSIMIKGNVYTVGSPAYLSQKFGTEYKVDVMLTSDNEEEGIKCDTFFAKEFPTSVLSIKREKARIYSIPASDITLPDLFDKMKSGKDRDNGYNYYTCSSSSLERVFMEIVHISEKMDEEDNNLNEKQNSPPTSTQPATENPVIRPYEVTHEVQDISQYSASSENSNNLEMDDNP